MKTEAEEMGEPQLRLVLPDDNPPSAAPWAPATPPVGVARAGSGSATSAPGRPATTQVSGPVSGPAAGATNTATSAPGEGATSDPGAEPSFELELYGRPMTPAEKGLRLARHLAGMTAENWARPGGLGHGIIRGHPSSAGQHVAYVRSRAWVPEGLEGSAVSKAGALYGYTVGLAGVLAGNCIAWTFERPLRLFLACLVAGITVLIVALTWLQNSLACEGPGPKKEYRMGTGVSAGAFVVLAAITLTMAWKRHRPRWVAVFAAATGLAGAAPILGWLGGLASAQILGAGITTVISVVGTIILWHEVVKNNGRHKVRTPLVAFVWAVAMMAVGGAVGHVAHQFSHGLITTVDHVTPNGGNG